MQWKIGIVATSGGGVGGGEKRPEKIMWDVWGAVMHCSFIRLLVTQVSPQCMKRESYTYN